MSNKRGKYNSKHSNGILDGFSAVELAEQLEVSRSTAYYKLAIANEVLDAIAELKKNNNHESNGLQQESE